ncbi:MAG: hypothetical protein QOJ42_51 [Acidobacteriaceae bacterium]|nr:hypothetical protein [Acidobacteriaceae bacterium]
MLTSELTGDLPEIIGNEENLYEGNLILYFRILFYNSTNLKNPYHNFRHTLHVLWLCQKAARIIRRNLRHVKCATCSSLRYSTSLIILAILIQANKIRIG